MFTFSFFWKVSWFSFDPDCHIEREQMCCYLTRTTSETHKLIRDNLDETPTYGGWIEAKGPRYCPSIEDKVPSSTSTLDLKLWIKAFFLTIGNMLEVLINLRISYAPPQNKTSYDALINSRIPKLLLSHFLQKILKLFLRSPFHFRRWS